MNETIKATDIIHHLLRISGKEYNDFREVVFRSNMVAKDN